MYSSPSYPLVVIDNSNNVKVSLVARRLQIVSHSCKIKVWEWTGKESAEDKWKVGGEDERGNGGEGRRRKERREGGEGRGGRRRKTIVATMVQTNRLVGLRPTLVTCVGGYCHHRFDLCCPGNDPSYSNQLSNAVRLHFAN